MWYLSAETWYQIFKEDTNNPNFLRIFSKEDLKILKSYVLGKEFLRILQYTAFMPILTFLWHRFGPYFIEPVIAGLDPKTNEPFVASCDLIGCPMIPEDFVVTGTCSEQLYGMCESLWEPDMVSMQ